MAAPNLKTPTTITGETYVSACLASLTATLVNAAASGKVLKVNTIRVANLTANSATVDITFYRSSTHTYILKSGSVAPNSSLVILDRDEYIYLEEGDALYAKASAITTLDLTINYEEIS